MDYSALSDEDLMTMYYAGDDLAFAELHRRFQSRLFTVAFRRLLGIAGRREAADELSAQTLVRAALTRQRPSARWNPAKGLVSPWLFTILHRVVTSHLQRSGHELPTSDLSVSQARAEARLEELLTADDLAPLERLAQAELQAALRACIEKLPEPLRQIVGMLLDGLRQTDIAEVLGISDPTAMRYCRRAYAQLIECLRQKRVVD